jgi:hypothetical protein
MHETQRMILIGDKPQDDYLTPIDTADETNFVRLEVTDKDFGKLTPQTSDNEDDAHGFEQATEQYLEGWNFEKSHGLAVSSEQIGRILLLIFGSVVTTQPDAVGAPNVYQHVFKPADISTSRQALATTGIEILGTALNRKHPSLCMKNWSIKGDGQKRIESNFSFIGSGKEVRPSGLSVAQAKARLLTGLHYFFNSQAKVTIADAGTLANAVNYGATRRHNTWDFGFENKFAEEEGYFPGGDQFQTTGDTTSGATRTELLIAKRAATASLDVRFKDQGEEHAALLAQKKLDWKTVLTGGLIEAAFKHKLTLEAHQLQYTMVELTPASSGLINAKITPKLEVNPSTGDWLTATLINSTPSYV